jgi:Fe(3+) dicitrate transport protein
MFALHKLKILKALRFMPVKNRSTDKLTANKATNNARQIFAQVVGLTINESSDGGLQLSIGGRGLDQIERLT